MSPEELKDGLGGKIPQTTYELLIEYAATKKGRRGDPRVIIGGDKPTKGVQRVSKSVMPSRMKFKGKDELTLSELQKPPATPMPGVSETSIQPSTEQKGQVKPPKGSNPAVSLRGHDPKRTDDVVCEVQRRLRSGTKKALLYFNSWDGSIGKNLGLQKKPLSQQARRIVDGYGMEFDQEAD